MTNHAHFLAQIDGILKREEEFRKQNYSGLDLPTWFLRPVSSYPFIPGSSSTSTGPLYLRAFTELRQAANIMPLVCDDTPLRLCSGFLDDLNLGIGSQYLRNIDYTLTGTLVACIAFALWGAALDERLGISPPVRAESLSLTMIEPSVYKTPSGEILVDGPSLESAGPMKTCRYLTKKWELKDRSIELWLLHSTPSICGFCVTMLRTQNEYEIDPLLGDLRDPLLLTRLSEASLAKMAQETSGSAESD